MGPAHGVPPLTIAVNISALQLIQPDFTDQVARIIRESGIDPQWIELEITESVAIQSVETTVAKLVQLKNLGVKLAIDDFGTGYSSLSYLRRFPIDKLKVDQSFVRNLTKDANDAAITRAVIQLGHSLNLKVIAEGVETTEHLDRLQDYACDEMQGYLFSKPLPAEDLENLLKAGKALPRHDAQLRTAA
jgi:EAL domain-containing protein (putative c-di-GMP-specific phosphodiesterase class I)